MVNIYYATFSNLPALLALGERMHAESEHYARIPFSYERTRDVLHALTNQGRLLVAQDHIDVLGMLGLVADRAVFSDAIMAADVVFYVAPEHRGTGAGRALLRRGEEWAREHGAVSFQIGLSTGVDTERTARFLERLGYSRGIVGLHKELTP